MRCSVPGCTGSIVDGWCDVCGSPGGTAATTGSTPPASGSTRLSSGPAPRASGPAPVGGRCAQPGCSGTVVDGWCDVCGSPAAGAVPPPVGSARASLQPSSGVQPPSMSGRMGPLAEDSSPATGSQSLRSTQLGSARARGSTATRRTGSARLRHARIGAGLTSVPPAPVVDAAQAVMADPSLPERKRVCPQCQTPVGRSRDGQPGRTEGFCPKCGAQFSFTPKLKAGDLIAAQYEVAGCLAYGGMGWIYLARDRNVSDRWVVLKGLLNSADADAVAAALSEQQFLAQVEHPLIVEIYNFVSHEGAGYIVMEYVGGRSLKDLLKDRMRANGGDYDPLPPDQAIAYILEILPAFSYLHETGLLYCDFKPDNVVQVGDALKLIDLGGVRRIDDDQSAIYGTVGYQAPEIASRGATIASDLYTIGRTLAVLTMELKGYQSRYQFSLPPVSESRLFAEHDSLHRLLLKCCAPDPADRFASVDELRVQLLGLLREEVGQQTAGTALTSAASVLFEPPAAVSESLEWSDLPDLRPDTTDPQYGWLQNVDLPDPRQRREALLQAPEVSAEVGLELCRCELELASRADLDRRVEDILAVDPWEWRAVWMSGLGALQAGDPAAAVAAFNAVYGQAPGELAPKLALALACELNGDAAMARSLYERCAGTDANYVTPAAFGLARLSARERDLATALAALDRIPATSRGYAESRRLRAQHLIALGGRLEDCAAALSSIEGARLGDAEKDRFTVDVLDAALAKVLASPTPTGGQRVGRWPATEEGLRDGLETTYRRMARRTSDPAERIRLVDTANQVRQWSLT